MTTLREILEAYSQGNLTRDELVANLIRIGMTEADAKHAVFIEDGGDDVIDLDDQDGEEGE